MAAATGITYNEGRGAVIVTGTCTINPGSISAGGNEDMTIAASGVKVGDLCLVSPNELLLDGLVISAVGCYAAGTITFTVENHTGGALDEGSTVFNWGYIRGQQQVSWAG